MRKLLKKFMMLILYLAEDQNDKIIPAVLQTQKTEKK